MALSEHPNPTAAWAAAARWLLSLDEPGRTALTQLAQVAYRTLRDVSSVNELLNSYRTRAVDSTLWDQAQTLAPQFDRARACRLARDAGYFKRYRELLDGKR